MRITSINSHIQNNHIYTKNQTFTAHPDFYRINSLQSAYFRRGIVALPNTEGYADIENHFYKIFNTDLKEPIKMLIIGIGNSQEIFSYLATIKGIIKDKNLNKYVDLYVVDLQSKPSYEKLRLDSFLDLLPYEKFPQYAGKSFIKDKKFPKLEPDINTLSPIDYYLYLKKFSPCNKKYEQPRKADKDYRVNDEILNFVNETYNNPEKSKWDSRIQDVILDYPNKNFNIISANNVFGYINDDDYLSTLKNIKRILKTKGSFISDPYVDQDYVKSSEVLSTFSQLYKGIYQKL